jgi:hypothetical protein
MNDPNRYSDEKADTTRRWVKVVGIIALLIALLVVVMLLAGGGHRPRRHSLGSAHQAQPNVSRTSPATAGSDTPELAYQ